MKKVLITGATGLVGSHLMETLGELGWHFIALTRDKSIPGFVHWDPSAGIIDNRGFEGCDCVAHLAGENIASGRWTEERRRLIIESREKGTRLLCHALAMMRTPPKVLICASGSNYYQDNMGGVLWDESGPMGQGFLSTVCERWEAATAPASDAGIRVVHARLGTVLSTRGGMLTRILPVICSGLGGVVGEGSQRISWIHALDLVKAFRLMMENESFSGPVNVVSPNPVSNRCFMQTVAKTINRPCFVNVPGRAMKWLYGEMASELLLADNAVFPARLTQGGMVWDFPTLEAALEDLLAAQKCAR
jgi:uncharacterized protein (TIGR01777 family)